MMRLATLLGLVVVSLPIGCGTLDKKSSIPPVTGPRLDGAAAQSKELPNAEAARLCLITAQKLEKSKHDAQAIAYYERARSKDPRGMQPVCRRLAVLYDRTGQYQNALEEYQRALAVTPNDADLLNDVGYCHQTRGLWKKAEEHYRKALALDGKHRRVWNNLGIVLGQQNRQDEALEAFRQVVSGAQAYNNLAFVLMTQGKKVAAEQAYRRALTLDPDLALPREAVAKLEKINKGAAPIVKASASMPAPPKPSHSIPKRELTTSASPRKPAIVDVVSKPATLPQRSTLRQRTQPARVPVRRRVVAPIERVAATPKVRHVSQAVVYFDPEATPTGDTAPVAAMMKVTRVKVPEKNGADDASPGTLPSSILRHAPFSDGNAIPKR